MPTKTKYLPGLIWLALLPILSIFISNHLPTQTWWGILVLCLPWLVTGAVFKSVARDGLPEGGMAAVWRILLGLCLLLVLWYLPTLLPFLKSSDYGIAINLREGPVALWMGAAFILGFYRKLIAKSFAGIWSGLKEYFIRKTGLEWPKNENLKLAEVWSGLKSMARDLFK